MGASEITEAPIHNNPLAYKSAEIAIHHGLAPVALCSFNRLIAKFANLVGEHIDHCSRCVHSGLSANVILKLRCNHQYFFFSITFCHDFFPFIIFCGLIIQTQNEFFPF